MRGPIFVGRAAVGRTILGPGRNPGSAGVLIIGPGLLNGDFETLGAGGADVFASWAEVVNGTSTVNADTTNQHSGSQCCRLDIDAANSSANVLQTVLTVGHTYRVTGWTRAASGTPTGRIRCGATTLLTPDLTTTWQSFDVTFVAAAAGLALDRGSAASNSVYYDDVTLTDLGA